MTDRLAFLMIWIGCLLAGLIAIVWLLLAGLVNPHSQQTRKLAISFDQTANAAFGGSEDETISSRANRERAKVRHGRAGCADCSMLLSRVIAKRVLVYEFLTR